MKTATLRLVMATCGFICSSALAQTTVYNDNFASDSALSSSYINMNNISGSVNEWAFTADTQLQLTTAGSGKLDDLVGSFTPVTLSQAGQYLSFVVNFNSPNLGQGGTGAAGALLYSLDYSGGVPLGASPENPTATTGATAGYIGYLGDMALNNSPKSATKFHAKTGGATNDISYYSDALPDVQLAVSEPTSSAANLANNDNYTLTYTITALNAGGTQNQITASIYDNTLSALEESFAITATNSAGTFITPATTYDTFDVGIYTGSESSGYDINLTDVSIIASVPEPSTYALAGVGFGLALLARFRRR